MKKLLIENKEDLVLFGEGNFTFSIAIAVLRQSSWEGMTVTCFEKDKHPFFCDTQLKAIEYVISNAKSDHSVANKAAENMRDPSDILETIKRILSLSPIPLFGTWISGVDATNIPGDLSVEGKVVWFQCPWGHDPSTLIRVFLDHMVEKGVNFVLVGITKYTKYVGRYNIPSLLYVQQGGPASSKLHQYKFIGADVTLINEILVHGYKHEGFTDIHERIKNDHITLVFERIFHHDSDRLI